MKINCYYWENFLLISRLQEVCNYDLVYCDSDQFFKKSSIESLSIFIDSRISSDYERGCGIQIIKRVTNQRPAYVFEKSHTKIKKSITYCKLRNRNLKKFLYFLISSAYPILRRKQVSLSNKVDKSGQYGQNLVDFNLYLQVGVADEIYDWNAPIQVIYNFFKDASTVKNYYNLQLIGILILQ